MFSANNNEKLSMFTQRLKGKEMRQLYILEINVVSLRLRVSDPLLSNSDYSPTINKLSANQISTFHFSCIYKLYFWIIFIGGENFTEIFIWVVKDFFSMMNCNKKLHLIIIAKTISWENIHIASFPLWNLWQVILWHTAIYSEKAEAILVVVSTRNTIITGVFVCKYGRKSNESWCSKMDKSLQINFSIETLLPSLLQDDSFVRK